MNDSIRKLPVKVAVRPDGKLSCQVASKMKGLGAALPDSISEMSEGGMLASAVTPARRKIAASRWFLGQLRKCLYHEGAALMFLEAFLSELRATTLVLQKHFKSHPGFESWYQKQRLEMGRKSDLRWLVEARNAAQKEGLEFASWWPRAVVRLPKKGKPFAESLPPDFTIAATGRTVGLDTLEGMLTCLDRIIEEAHALFYQDPPGREMQMRIEMTRERDDGKWEHFDL